MFRDLKVLLDSPPNGVFTYEDTVSGKVVLESPRDEAIGWIYVFFHGWANTEVIHHSNTQYSGGPTTSKYTDKEVLFQSYQKVYEGHEKLAKKVPHEWSFRFDIQMEKDDAYSLPTSGKYAHSSIEYKIIVVPGRIGQSEEHIMSRMNPGDRRFLKEAPLNPTDVFLWVGKHLGGVAEQTLQFAQMRPESAIDPYVPPPFHWALEIASYHLPGIQQTMPASPEKHGLFHTKHKDLIPFSVDLQIPRNIVEGAVFPMLLSISSPNEVWSRNPPPVTLVAFKIYLQALTIERASQQSSEDVHKRVLFEAKKLNIPLGPRQLDIGQLFSLRLTGDGVVPSFNTRLLQRKYDIPTELTIEVGGKSFLAAFTLMDRITLLSRLVATGRRPLAPLPKPKQEPTTFHLKYSYIGRLTQDGNGPLQEDSVMEAAITLSRILTRAEIQHSFPKGSAVKLLPYKPDSRHVNNIHWDPITDCDKVHAVFKQEGQFRAVPTFDVLSLTLAFSDPLHGENITVYFPPLSPQSDSYQEKFVKETRGRTDDVKLDPVSLFNYRLSCAVTREKLGDPELGDFELLYKAFSHELHSHRRHIHVNMARIAAGRYPSIGQVLGSIGVDVVTEEELNRQREPQVDANHDYEEDLVKGFKKDFFHKDFSE